MGSDNSVPLPNDIVKFSLQLYSSIKENFIGRFLMDFIEVNDNWIDTKEMVSKVFEYGYVGIVWDGEDVFYGHIIPQNIKYDLNRRIKEFRMMQWIDGKYQLSPMVYYTQGKDRNAVVVQGRNDGLPVLSLNHPTFEQYDRAKNALSTNIDNLNDKMYVQAVQVGTKDITANDRISQTKLLQLNQWRNSRQPIIELQPGIDFVKPETINEDRTDSINKTIERLESELRSYAVQPTKIIDKQERVQNSEMESANDNSNMLEANIRDSFEIAFKMFAKITDNKVNFKFKELEEEKEMEEQEDDIKNNDEEV